MATTGKAKWEKYFSNREVNTKIIKSDACVYNSITHELNVLKEGSPITVLSSSAYSPRYAIEYTFGGKLNHGTISEKYVAKPTTVGGATESLRINSSMMTSEGQIETLSIGNQQVVCRTFDDSDLLVSNIRTAFERSPHVSDRFQQWLHDFDRADFKRINWHADIATSEKNELGKYVGELLIGIYALRGVSSMFDSDIIPKQAIKFAVPVSPSFRGIDSIIMFRDHAVIIHKYISSKYGRGAKASFFGNVMGKALDRNGKYGGVFGDLYTITKNLQLNSDTIAKSVKPIIYEYGIRKILDISPKHVQNVMSVYHDIRMNSISDTTEFVLERARAIADENRQKPTALTNLFGSHIANRLNNDPISIQSILNLLIMTNMWQVNLNINKWYKGEIFFKTLHITNAKLKIMSNRSAIDDIAGTQGILGYELRY